MRVKSVRRVVSDTEVYDIQTGTENFFAEGVLVHNCMTDAVLTEPYGGYCTVGCSFCYINSGMRGYRGSGLITVPIDYGAQVARMIGKLRTGTAGYFSSFTDPFLPLESIYHNTRSGAEAFDRAGLPVFFLWRFAARNSLDPLYQEPPRTPRRERSPPAVRVKPVPGLPFNLPCQQSSVQSRKNSRMS